MNLKSQRGAALVEAAVVVPVIMFFMFSIVEGGVLFSEYASLGNAARDAARAESVTSNGASADYDGLQAMKPSMAGLHGATITRIVVFKANAFGVSLPTQCATGPSNSAAPCNVYAPSDINRPVTDFESQTWPAPLAWPATSRNVSRTGGTDLVGVAVQAQLPLPIGVFGLKTFNITRVNVVQLEAQES